MARVSENFWHYVDRSGGPDACWPWKRSRDTGGYGQLWENGRLRRAHQVAFEWVNGPCTNNTLHHCDNPPCCNPVHLYDGSLKQNSQDRERRGRGRPGRLNGNDHGRAILRDVDVLEVRTRMLSDAKYAKKFGVSKSTIYA